MSQGGAAVSRELKHLHDTVSDKFIQHARHPRNLGHVPQPDALATAVGQCGDSVEVSIRVQDGTITEVGVVPHGCLYTVACASAMSELAKGRTVDQALELGPEDIEREVEGLPEDHLHCARLAVNTLGEAIEEYYRRQNRPAAQGGGGRG